MNGNNKYEMPIRMTAQIQMALRTKLTSLNDAPEIKVKFKSWWVFKKFLHTSLILVNIEGIGKVKHIFAWSKVRVHL